MQILNHWCELRLVCGRVPVPEPCVEVFGRHVCHACWQAVSKELKRSWAVLPLDWLAKGRD